MAKKRATKQQREELEKSEFEKMQKLCENYQYNEEECNNIWKEYVELEGNPEQRGEMLEKYFTQDRSLSWQKFQKEMDERKAKMEEEELAGVCKRINDKDEIGELMKNSQHLGTSFIKGHPGTLKTKTFNLYELEDSELLVTNHYGDELVNACVYPNEENLMKHYSKGKKEFNIYRMPLLP
jgi:hypothetical protein